MLKVNFENRELDIKVVNDAHISYQSSSPNPNNWVVIDGILDDKECILFYQWDGQTELDNIDYRLPYDIEF